MKRVSPQTNTGIYIHIPFCRQACHYCNFHFSTNLTYVTKIVDAICSEIQLKAQQCHSREIATLYFGGGTPSLIPNHLLKKIITTLQSNFQLQNISETTIECNPEDINDDTCDQFLALGFNRISLGVQSFHSADLQYMNRCHDGQTARQAIETIKKKNIDNFSIDLIYGTPTLSNAQWMANIKIAKEYNTPHISAYALTVEEGTALPAMIKKGVIDAPKDSKIRDQFIILRKDLLSNSYEHYEVSNFSLKGYRAKHNSNYWNRQTYLGFGPGAHSFDGQKRSWNISNNIKYMQSINNHIVPEEIEVLTDQDKFNECIMTSLRTSMGLDIRQLKADFPKYTTSNLSEELNCLIEKGLGVWQQDSFALTEEGLLVCDQISSNLFIV